MLKIDLQLFGGRGGGSNMGGGAPDTSNMAPWEIKFQNDVEMWNGKLSKTDGGVVATEDEGSEYVFGNDYDVDRVLDTLQADNFVKVNTSHYKDKDVDMYRLGAEIRSPWTSGMRTVPYEIHKNVFEQVYAETTGKVYRVVNTGNGLKQINYKSLDAALNAAASAMRNKVKEQW